MRASLPSDNTLRQRRLCLTLRRVRVQMHACRRISIHGLTKWMTVRTGGHARMHSRVRIHTALGKRGRYTRSVLFSPPSPTRLQTCLRWKVPFLLSLPPGLSPTLPVAPLSWVHCRGILPALPHSAARLHAVRLCGAVNVPLTVRGSSLLHRDVPPARRQPFDSRSSRPPPRALARESTRPIYHRKRDGSAYRRTSLT